MTLDGVEQFAGWYRWAGEHVVLRLEVRQEHTHGIGLGISFGDLTRGGESNRFFKNEGIREAIEEEATPGDFDSIVSTYALCQK